MFITKRSLSRRTVLKGDGRHAGAAVPRRDGSRRDGAGEDRRAAGRFGLAPCSCRWASGPSHWTPATTGAGFEFSPILKPIERFRDIARHRLQPGSSAGRDARGQHVDVAHRHRRRSGPRPKTSTPGISLDQVAAGLIGKDTVFPSLEIATEDQAGYIGACDVGYSCAYMSTIAWKGPTTPLPMEINPRVVFERMFGRPGTPADRLARMRADQSILDSVRHDVASLQHGLGAARSHAVERISRPRARDRAAHSARRASGDRKDRGAGRAGRRAGVVRRARGRACSS